jgi:copper(I)-binding protein
MVKADWKNISRRPLLVFGFTVLTPMIFAAPTQAADYDAGSIHITAPWARATPKGFAAPQRYVSNWA